MCKSCWCSLHNKFRYSFSYQITLEKLSLGSRHLFSLLKQCGVFFWGLTNAILSLLTSICNIFEKMILRLCHFDHISCPLCHLWHLFVLLVCSIKQKASSFSKLFIACPSLVISHSALWNRLSLLLRQQLPPSASAPYKNTKAASSSLPPCPLL